jgi:Cysteine-rich secretory protein family
MAKIVCSALLVTWLSFVAPAPAVAGESSADLDQQVLAELNFARTHPQDYARRLRLTPVSDWEKQLAPEDGADDPGALAEAIDFLMRQPQLAPLGPDESLTGAALEHVAEQGPGGEIGHDGSDGETFDARLRRHGLNSDWAAEDIAYGPRTAQDVVRELIIDRGVADRGHRLNIFLPTLTRAGVSCGPHAAYDEMCVIDFEGAPRQAPRQIALADSERLRR